MLVFAFYFQFYHSARACGDSVTGWEFSRSYKFGQDRYQASDSQFDSLTESINLRLTEHNLCVKKEFCFDSILLSAGEFCL